MPTPGTMLRTTASARITPPGTSKTRVRSVPTRWVMEPQRKRPPMLSVWTRETCCWPPPYQVTDMPLGREIRWYRRFPLGGSLGMVGVTLRFRNGWARYDERTAGAAALGVWFGRRVVQRQRRGGR